MKFVVKNGFYKLEGVPACPKCGMEDGLQCYPGEFPQCFSCQAIFLSLGRTPKAPCVTPNGRVDGHMEYVRHKDGVTRCAFCGEVA